MPLMRQHTESSKRAESHLTPVVYTMGKVASTSTSRAIQAAGLTCYDIHTLDRKSLIKSAKKRLDKGKFPLTHISIAMAKRERLFRKKEKCLYISLVRDPVARNLSAFFQNLDHYPNEIQKEKDPAIVFKYFQQNYNHESPLTWFDREFLEQLSINVYTQKFDTDLKYVYIKSANTVIFRTDCPDETKGLVLSELLGSEIRVGRSNDAGMKHYSDLYRNVTSVARYSPEHLDKLYTSKYAKHFWSDTERCEFREKWLGPQQ
ncbi:MAG: sulfotransferase family 2 domain-containing protein [Pararhodobacter sp.]|nr:sulfotransferase family 2 domain-containing protein [Pararhodobacter sp.]